MKPIKHKIILDTSQKPFYYEGFIIEEGAEFILFNDDKIGEVRLNKSKVITIKECEQ